MSAPLDRVIRVAEAERDRDVARLHGLRAGLARLEERRRTLAGISHPDLAGDAPDPRAMVAAAALASRASAAFERTAAAAERKLQADIAAAMREVARSEGRLRAARRLADARRREAARRLDLRAEDEVPLAGPDGGRPATDPGERSR